MAAACGGIASRAAHKGESFAAGLGKVGSLALTLSLSLALNPTLTLSLALALTPTLTPTPTPTLTLTRWEAAWRAG